MGKLIFWAKIVDGRYLIESAHNRALHSKFLKEREKQEVKCTFEDKKRPKSEDALGMYFGGVIPAWIAQDKELIKKGDIEHDPMILRELCLRRKIRHEEVEDYHRMIMLEFRPIRTRTLSGKYVKQGDILRDKPNTYLIKLIDDVLDYMARNGYEIPNNEEYKKVRDEAKYLRGEKVIEHK